MAETKLTQQKVMPKAEQKEMLKAEQKIPPVIPKEEIKPDPKNLCYQRDRDREKVKGIFRFYEVPGGCMSFVFKQYLEDPVEKYELVDGQIYTLPLGVAKHLNKSGRYPVHAHEQDERGNVSVRVGKMVARYGFQSLEFVDIEEFSNRPSEIVTVEKISTF